MKTYTPKASEIQREWHVVDADGIILGRLATEVARVLRGKHKPTFAPHIDTGDHVIVINAAKLAISPRKAHDKLYHRHTGYPGGIRTQSLERMMERNAEQVVRQAVKRMLPKGPLGRAQMSKLKVYAGADHPHTAQAPKPLTIR
jgi:large subunit ribosomal protein L13